MSDNFMSYLYDWSDTFCRQSMQLEVGHNYCDYSYYILHVEKLQLVVELLSFLLLFCLRQ